MFFVLFFFLHFMFLCYFKLFKVFFRLYISAIDLYAYIPIMFMKVLAAEG